MMHINLEFQNDYRPTDTNGRTYPLVKRGIYYVAREISAQLGRITQKTNYNDIEKAISIWVVNDNIPLSLQNTASRYYMEKEDFIGSVEEPESDYDLIEVVIIRTGENPDITKPVFDYLKALYDANIEEIDKYTPASDNPEIVKEVSDMPGMSQTIFNNGYDSGYGSGYGNGILDLVNDGDISVERAAEKLHKTPDEIQKLLNDFLSSKKTELN